MRLLFASCAFAFLLACPPAPPRCEVDSGTSVTEAEVQLRVFNLSRGTAVVKLEGEDGGERVARLGSLTRVGKTSAAALRGTIEAHDVLADGGTQPVTLTFEFDPDVPEPVTLVIKDVYPGRMSTNMSIERQTPKRDFGEKVAAALGGVEIEGGVDTDGDCLTDAAGAAGSAARVGLHGEPPAQDCPGTTDNDFVRPAEAGADATPYFIQGRDVGELEVAWVPAARKGSPAVGNGAALLGGALPGGAVISASLRPLYILNADSSALPAKVSIEGVELAAALAPGALVRVKSNLIAEADRKLVAANGVRREAVVEFTVGSATRTLGIRIDLTGPRRSPYVCDFLNDEATLLVVSENPSSSATVLKVKHDTAKNSVGNIRGFIAFSSTTVLETRGCVAVFPTDDTCVMGSAVVSAVSAVSAGGPRGGASSAAYAATGRLLYPPKVPPQGVPMVMGVAENGAVVRRFVWDDPAGLTPTTVHTPSGLVVIASGLVLDPAAIDRRALFFVNTDANPWTVQATLSR